MLCKMWKVLSRGDFAKNAIRIHVEHYEAIHALVSKERILEYRVQEGWGPLVEFLGATYPKDEFPKPMNDKNVFERRFKIAAQKMSLRKIGQRLLLLIFVTLYVAWPLWQYFAAVAGQRFICAANLPSTLLRRY